MGLLKYLLGRDEQPLIYHLDGRRYFSDAQREEKRWCQNPNAVNPRPAARALARNNSESCT